MSGRSSVYRFMSYKSLILYLIKNGPREGRGVRKKLADFLGCQGSFITQVLSGSLHFSIEQAEACTRFFEFSRDEAEYFMLLTAYEKAGTKELRAFLKTSLETQRDRHLQVKHAIQIERELSAEVQATYYSSWHYAAIHMALTIPSLTTRAALSEKLKVPKDRVEKVLDYLVANGIVTKSLQQEYLPTERWLHLGKNSPMINVHHLNLRAKAMQHLDEETKTDLHYSAFISCSKKDLTQLQDLFLRALDEFQAIVKSSPEEELAGITIDFFRV